MQYQHAHITQEILCGQSPTGDLYTLVSFADGNIGVAKNGKPLPMHWPMTDEGMKQCTEHFLWLTEKR